MKLRKCPFCKKDVNTNSEFMGVHHNRIIDKWTFSHNCSIRPIDVSVVVYGDSKEEVIEKWNGVREK